VAAVFQSLIQSVLSGLAVGSMYGVVALGYYLTYQSSRSVNFSQGQSLMLGAVLYYTLSVTLGWPLAASLVASVVALVAVGMAIERAAVRPFLRRSSAGWLLSTVAIGVVLENGAMLVMGKETRALTSSLTTTSWTVLSARVYPLELLLPLIGLATALTLETVLRRTGFGRSMRATAFSHDAARIVGIEPERVNAAAYALSSVLAGVSGILLAPLLNVSATMGSVLGLKAFVVAIVGGIGSVRGIMLAGALCGLVESVMASVVGTGAREVSIFLLVIIVLIARPTGLISSKSTDRA
jgi:branched-chain amino acid transport system permease protein